MRGIKNIVLVEPFAHLSHGHYRDKLLIWLREFKKLDIKVRLVTMEPLPYDEFPYEEIYLIPEKAVRVANKLPHSLRLLYLLTASYGQGIRLSNEYQTPMLGLTSRAALPLWLAMLWKGAPSQPWGFHLMNCFLDGPMGFLQKVAFKEIIKKQCHIFANLNANLVRLNLDQRPSVATYLPDPISIFDSPPREKDGVRLFLSGKDDSRRNAVKVVTSMTLPDSIKVVHMHGAGGDDCQYDNFKKLNPHVELILTSGFASDQEFHAMFAKADICLISYDPTFPAGSGNLINALVAGTPVVSSKLSHALHVNENYPGTVELFDYQDTNSLLNAFNKVISRTSDENQHFLSRVNDLKREVSAETIVKRCLDKLCG